MQSNQGKRLVWALKKLIDICMFMADLCMASMITLVSVNCFLRYAVGKPIYWGDEIMIYLMMLMAYLAFGYMLIEDRMIRMTALTGRMSVPAQNKIWVFTSLLTLAYNIFLLAGGIYITVDSYQMGAVSTVTGDPIGPWQGIICFGLAVLVMATVLFAINKIRAALGHKAEEPATKDEIILGV
jgi:TRAP-type C4-dicarboxylate transport system permease small subunit